MTEQFIYVYNTAARDKMKAAGFLMLKEDERNSVYIFSLNGRPISDVEALDVSFIKSNTLTF